MKTLTETVSWKTSISLFSIDRKTMSEDANVAGVNNNWKNQLYLLPGCYMQLHV